MDGQMSSRERWKGRGNGWNTGKKFECGGGSEEDVLKKNNPGHHTVHELNIEYIQYNCLK